MIISTTNVLELAVTIATFGISVNAEMKNTDTKTESYPTHARHFRGAVPEANEDLVSFRRVARPAARRRSVRIPTAGASPDEETNGVRRLPPLPLPPARGLGQQRQEGRSFVRTGTGRRPASRTRIIFLFARCFNLLI